MVVKSVYTGINSNPRGTQVAFTSGMANGAKRFFGVCALSLIAISTAKQMPKSDTFVSRVNVVEPVKKAIDNETKISEDDLKGLNKVWVTNFEGGKIFRYTTESENILRNRIIQPMSSVSYGLPIQNTKDVYLHDLGMFGAPRTGGRPHQGLDIYVTPGGIKPAKPVPITSPIDGVVISRKNANSNNNVISNMVTILGVDGHKYSFDHMARKEDYLKFKHINIPDVGTIIKKGDTLGYVGRTGETAFWHLHLIIMTKNALKKQFKDSNLILMTKKSKYTKILGQVDPLNFKDAGKIAKLLKKYAKR